MSDKTIRSRQRAAETGELPMSRVAHDLKQRYDEDQIRQLICALRSQDEADYFDLDAPIREIKALPKGLGSILFNLGFDNLREVSCLHDHELATAGSIGTSRLSAIRTTLRSCGSDFRRDLDCLELRAGSGWASFVVRPRVKLGYPVGMNCPCHKNDMEALPRAYATHAFADPIWPVSRLAIETEASVSWRPSTYEFPEEE